MTEPETYRPVSLLAISGLILAGLWILVLAIGVIGAALAGAPLLVHPLVQGIAGAGLARCLGLASDQALRRHPCRFVPAGWAFFLSIITLLSYWAYYAAITLAIRQQADTFTHQWIGQLRQGNIDEAFRLTLEPNRRPPDGTSTSELRDMLESRFNPVENERISPHGRYTRFRLHSLVRMIVEGNEDTRFKSLGVSWDYKGQAYSVCQHVEVTTPEQTCKVFFTVIGSRATRKESSGRQWYVSWDDTRIDAISPPSPLGEKRNRLRREARDFTDKWLKKWTQNRIGAIPPVYSSDFWAPGAMRLFIPQEVAQMFCWPGKDSAAWIKLANTETVVAPAGSNCLRVERDFLLVRRPATNPALKILPFTAAQPQVAFPGNLLRLAASIDNLAYMVDGVLVAEADPEQVGADGHADWHISTIRLIHARELTGVMARDGSGVPSTPFSP